MQPKFADRVALLGNILDLGGRWLSNCKDSDILGGAYTLIFVWPSVRSPTILSVCSMGITWLEI